MGPIIYGGLTLHSDESSPVFGYERPPIARSSFFLASTFSSHLFICPPASTTVNSSLPLPILDWTDRRQVFLPPYSPDFYSIENAFSKLKVLLWKGMEMDNQSQAGHPVQPSAASPAEEHANVQNPGRSNCWTDLPLELQAMIIAEVASFRDRREAHEAIRSFRASSSITKELIDNAPMLTADIIEALHRNPKLDREEAAAIDYGGGRLPREACRVNNVTDKKEVDSLVMCGARSAFASDPNATAQTIIDRFEVDNPKDMEELRFRGTIRDVSMGMSPDDAADRNGMTNDDHRLTVAAAFSITVDR